MPVSRWRSRGVGAARPARPGPPPRPFLDRVARGDRAATGPLRRLRGCGQGRAQKASAAARSVPIRLRSTAFEHVLQQHGRRSETGRPAAAVRCAHGHQRPPIARPISALGDLCAARRQRSCRRRMPARSASSPRIATARWERPERAGERRPRAFLNYSHAPRRP